MYLDIVNSKLQASDDNEATAFDFSDVEGLRAYFKAHGTLEVSFSSSLDFPDEYGVSLSRNEVFAVIDAALDY